MAAEQGQSPHTGYTPPEKHDWHVLELARRMYESDGTIILNPHMTSLQDLYLADADWLRDFWTYVGDCRAAYDKFKPKEKR